MSVLANNEYGEIKKEYLTDELELLVINHNYCQAKISLYGGQVLSWQPKNQKDIFWLSKAATFKQGKAIRGGIPLCWPWFGQHCEDVDASGGNHGFARESIWQVESVSISENNVAVVLSLQGINKHPLWPQAFKLTQVLNFGESFSQSLTMANLTEQDAYISTALHTYFAVSSSEDIIIDSLNHAPFDDKLTGKFCSPQLLANGIGPVDRVYHDNNTIQIIDKSWQRVIAVKANHSKQWVFWNPGVEVANTMADIHKNGEQEFVCLEAAITDKHKLMAGESFTISQEINVTPCE